MKTLEECHLWQNISDECNNTSKWFKKYGSCAYEKINHKRILIFDHENDNEPFETDMNWLKNNKIKFKETVYEGLEMLLKHLLIYLMEKI